MLRSPVPAACLALTLTLSASALEPPKAEETWVALNVEDFRIVSAVSPRETQRIARDLLRLRAVLGKVSDLRLHSAAPARVFVFPTQQRFEQYCQALRRSKCEGVGGLFAGGPGRNAILLPGDAKDGIARIVYHELTHHFVANTSTTLPLWLNEGLAEYVSTFRMAGANMHLGNPIDDHVLSLGEMELVPLRRLFAATSSSPLYNEHTRSGVFHAQSWALVHYLLHDERRRAALQRFLGLLDGGKAVDDAAGEAFGMPLAELERALRAYIRGRSFTVYSMPAGDLPIAAVPEPETMSHDAVLERLGNLLAGQPLNAALAERFLQQALVANGRNAGAYAMLARLYDSTGRKAKADAAYAKVVELGSDDGEVYVLAGFGILARDASEYVKARPHFERAVALDPQSAAAWSGLGTTYLSEAGDRGPGIAALEKSIELDPHGEDAPFYLAQLLSGDGRRHRELRKVAEPLLARTKNEALRQDLIGLLAAASINAAVEKANAGGWAEALALVEAALPKLRDEGARKQALVIRDMIAAEAKKRP